MVFDLGGVLIDWDPRHLYRKLFAGDEAGKEKCLKDAHLPTTGIPTPVNAWLVNTGSKLVLVDTGGGKNFAPTLGRLPQNLAATGVSPDAVDIIVITHPHPDHIPGLLTGDGKMLFTNAIVHVNADDHAFWTSDEKRGTRGVSRLLRHG